MLHQHEDRALSNTSLHRNLCQITGSKLKRKGCGALHLQLPQPCGRMRQGHLPPRPSGRACLTLCCVRAPFPNPVTPQAPSPPSGGQHRSQGSLSSLYCLFECPRLSALFRAQHRHYRLQYPSVPGPLRRAGASRAGAEGSTEAGRDAPDAHPRRRRGGCGA